MTLISFSIRAIKGLRFNNEFRLPVAKATPVSVNNLLSSYRNYSINPVDLPKRMATEKTLPKLFNFVDQNVNTYKNLLKEAVAIASVSCDPKYRDECVRMVHWTQDKLKEVGAKTELRDVGFQTIDGKEIKLPPVLVGSLGNDTKKNTICIYGHLDVQPALKSDGWLSEPFELVERDGKLYGRGSTDDKGPVLGWLHAINAFKGVGEELPVNLKFIFECMEESGSEGLDALLLEQLKPAGFFDDVDYVCISDNYWLGTTKPCITYGLRGISYYFLEIECAKMDLHSGVYGGTVHEAMSDLIYLMNQLVDKDGKILVTDIYKSVAPLTENEKKLYTTIDFDTEAYRKSIDAPKLAHNGDKEQILMHRWRYPSLSLHGIEGAAFQPGAKTVIPGKVIGKFSIRLVPNQEPEEVEKLVFDYINKKWAERGSPNKMRISAQSGRAWTENPDHPHYQAAARAVKMIFQTDPDMSREGGSIPVTITLQEASNRNVLLLPMGAGDDMAHSQNEKLNVRNYIEGIKLFAAYMFEVSKLPK
ncbi:cytosolic non-specific dipeptidase [Amyelois transitella]|uniref:cytosolic non-specific dipeptidase n=1 Tax=Amyelois transitella TaxID=680683 RepID=UPI00067DE495|nr:cytosolic non-specific dipeptidase [Amyelois transitella]